MVHDGTYSIDFAVRTFGNPKHDEQNGTRSNNLPSDTGTVIVAEIRDFERKHDYKFLGAGISRYLVDLCPNLPACLWTELDVVPLVFETDMSKLHGSLKTVDEAADAMARRCVG